jgi:hypothetical protein
MSSSKQVGFQCGNGAACQCSQTEILLYSWWNVWKERNRQVFDSTRHSVIHVDCAVKEEVKMFLRAMREFRPP